MYKSICATVVLLTAFAFMSGSRSADASPTAPISPPIVAHGKLTNQTSTIPTITIFTPAQTGLYRLSIYATISKPDPGSGSDWIVNVGYTDDSGQGQPLGDLLYAYNAYPGEFSIQNFIEGTGGPTVTLEAEGGTPITYSVTENGPPDNSAYSLYYTLERLE
jgi:hypothetical protein